MSLLPLHFSIFNTHFSLNSMMYLLVKHKSRSLSMILHFLLLAFIHIVLTQTTTPEPVQPPQCSYTTSCNHKYEPGSLSVYYYRRDTSSTTEQKCEIQCDSDSACEGFFFQPDNCPSDQPNCIQRCGLFTLMPSETAAYPRENSCIAIKGSCGSNRKNHFDA